MQFGIKLPHPGLKAGICGVANIFFTKQTELQMMQQSGTKSLNSCNPQLHIIHMCTRVHVCLHIRNSFWDQPAD